MHILCARIKSNMNNDKIITVTPPPPPQFGGVPHPPPGHLEPQEDCQQRPLSPGIGNGPCRVPRGRVYLPFHQWHPATDYGLFPYKDLPSAQKENLPVANKIADSVICLPMHHALTDEDVEIILGCVMK